MGTSTEILVESFELLKTEPKLFVPKIFSMLLSSAWILAFLNNSISYFATLALTPVMASLGMVASLMVAAMVENRDNPSLEKSFYESLKRWKQVMAITVLVMILGFVLSIPMTIGIFYLAETGSYTILAIGAVISLLLLFGVGFVSYFLPIALLDKKSFRGGLKSSFRTSKNNLLQVTALLVFSIFLIGAAFASDRYLRLIGFAGFILGRGVSTVVNTYLFVVSPTFYLKEKINFSGS